MTDGLHPAAGPELSGVQPQIAPRSNSRGRVRTSWQRRRTHLLLGAFPLAVMTLATFLVLFSLMTARLKANSTAALPSSPTTALLARTSAGSSVRTRASGGGAAAIATPVAAREGAPAAHPAIVTRASGSATAGETGDD